MRGVRVAAVTSAADLAVAQLADAFAAEWPGWARTLTRHELEANFVSAGADALPRVFAAMLEGRAVGTIALRPWFGEAPMKESPWVRGLWVAPDQRGRGVYNLLADAVEADALRRGFERIYAATSGIEPLLARRGWRTFHRLHHEGEPTAWMVKPLRPRPAPVAPRDG